jgi:long-chain acyl-CoA synthetase
MSFQDQLAKQVAALPAKSIVHLLRTRVVESANARAARGRKNGVWSELTWAQLGQRVRNMANGLLASGLQPGDRVCIFSPTRLEWALLDLAISYAGGVTVPNYASNTIEETVFILENSGSTLAFADNDEREKSQEGGRLTRLVKAKPRVPAVRELFVIDEESLGQHPASSLAALEKKGEAYAAANPGALEARADAIDPYQPNCFIYTSGTTGNPKGVMLAHYSIVFECVALGQMNLMKPDDTMLLFLPMAHVFGKVAAAAWVALGFEMAFCDNVDKIMEYAAEAKPTVLPAVPRIFEKVYAGVIQKATSAPGVKGKLAKWAMGQFDQWAEAKMKGQEYSSLGLSLAKKLVFSKIAALLKERLGGRIKLCISGSAPLARKIAYFFEFNDLLILEAYGLTENAAGATANRPEKNKIGTVGAPFPGTELRLDPSDGEILLRGPHVMRGYWQNPEATKEVLGDDGWFRTGDIGEVDSEGYVRITDRKKDLIKTSGGKYIAPQNLENLLKANSSIISQVMIHGDRRKFVTALVTVSEEPVKALLAQQGVTGLSYADMAKHATVRTELQKVFDGLNATLPSYETIKNFGVLPRDFTIEDGELTPSLKVKRKVVTKKFIEVLDGFYGEKLEV